MTDFSRSRAILIGTARYRDRSFPALPAAANSLAALRNVLAAQHLCGWPADRITVIENSTDLRGLLQTLRRLARDAEDVLVVYFVGHGVLLPRGELCLALTDTSFADPDITGLEFSRVRDALLDSPARVKITVLDCCYSGRAIEALAGNDIADTTDTRGVCTLTASDHAAHVSADQRTTSFTGELVGLIGEGLANGPEWLSVGTLYLHLRHRLRQLGLPLPNKRSTDTIDQFAFTRNAAHGRPPALVVPVAKRRRRGLVPAIAGIGVVAALVAGLIVWNPLSGKDNNASPPSSSTPSSSSSSSAARTNTSSVAVTGSPTFDRMRSRNAVTIGVKDDQPGLGYKDPSSGAYSGFDVEIAELIATRLGFAADRITFKPVPAAVREQTIRNGEVDFYVGTYTITDKRKEQVSFAGPYYQGGQDLLVRKGDSVGDKEGLKGRKICSVTGSTPLLEITNQNLTEPGNVVAMTTYAQCVSALLSNSGVDAVTTDDAVLKGYAAQQPSELRVLGAPFTDVAYGVGLAKDDKAMRDALNDVLQEALDNGSWQSVYDSTLGRSGAPARRPVLQRY